MAIMCSSTFLAQISCSFYMPSTEFTPSKRGHILQLHNEDYTYEQIHKKNGCLTTAAWETVHCDNIHHTQNSLPHSGHLRHLNDKQCHMIIHEVQKYCCAPFKEIEKHVGGINEWQVQAVVGELGYHHRVACCKPFLRLNTVKCHI